jgi:uncharacterized protein (TIRG00374 family)
VIQTKTHVPAVAVPKIPRVDVTPADAAAPSAVPDAEERSVNLGRRFFNLRTGVSFLLGIAILVTVFRATSIHPAEILAQLRRVDRGVYALAIAVYATTFLFRGYRWQNLLHNVDPDRKRLPLVPLTEVIFISWFVNSVVPAKLGDVYRGYLLRREYGLSMSRTLGTVVAERVADVMALILLLGSSGYLVLRDRVSPEVSGLLRFGWILFALLLAGMIVAYFLGERLANYLPERLQTKYRAFAHGTFAALTPRNLPLLAILTVLSWSAEAGRLFFVMRALGLTIGPMGALFTVAAISLALIAPTPGGLGAVEGTFVLVLGVFGVAAPLALAVAVLDRLISYYSLIVIGLPAFLVTKRGR